MRPKCSLSDQNLYKNSNDKFFFQMELKICVSLETYGLTSDDHTGVITLFTFPADLQIAVRRLSLTKV